MTDATALRLAKERWGESIYVERWPHEADGFDRRCRIFKPVNRHNRILIGVGPTWEHAFIDAGVTP